MVYLIWLNQVRICVLTSFSDSEKWESWACWRDYYLAGHSVEAAVTEVSENLKLERI